MQKEKWDHQELQEKQDLPGPPDHKVIIFFSFRYRGVMVLPQSNMSEAFQWDFIIKKFLKWKRLIVNVFIFNFFSLINERAFSRPSKIVSILNDADTSTVIVFKALSDLTKY